MKILDKHVRIIEAAIKVFAQKGFFDAKISEIAKEAKIADGTIYLYFNNKYDILVSIFEEEMGKIIAQVRHLLEREVDPRKMLEIFAINHMTLMKEKKDLAGLMQMELRQSNKFIREYRNKKFIEYLDIISEIVRKGKDEGYFRKDIAPGVVKRAFFGALDEMSRLWVLSPNPHYSLEETAKHISDIFIKGMIQTGGKKPA